MQTVLDFEGILVGAAQATVPKRYQGFGWSGGFTAVDTTDPLFAQSGHGAVAAATGSATVVGVNGKSPRLHASDAGDFDLLSVVAGSAWNENLRITIVAYDNHVRAGRVELTVDKGDAALITFDSSFASIDKVVFRVRGRRDADPLDGGSGPTGVFDDITVEAPTATVDDITVEAPTATVDDWAL